MELTTSALGGAGRRPGRKVKEAQAEQHELVGFPASIAMGWMLQAAKYLRMHIRAYGRTAEIDHAVDALMNGADSIKAWRDADQKRTGYQYSRKVGHA